MSAANIEAFLGHLLVGKQNWLPGVRVFKYYLKDPAGVEFGLILIGLFSNKVMATLKKIHKKRCISSYQNFSLIV